MLHALAVAKRTQGTQARCGKMDGLGIDQPLVWLHGGSSVTNRAAGVVPPHAGSMMSCALHLCRTLCWKPVAHWVRATSMWAQPVWQQLCRACSKCVWVGRFGRGVIPDDAGCTCKPTAPLETQAICLRGYSVSCTRWTRAFTLSMCLAVCSQQWRLDLRVVSSFISLYAVCRTRVPTIHVCSCLQRARDDLHASVRPHVAARSRFRPTRPLRSG